MAKDTTKEITKETTAKMSALQADLDKEVEEQEKAAEVARKATLNQSAKPSEENEDDDVESVVDRPSFTPPIAIPKVAQIKDAATELTEDAKRIKEALAKEPKVIFHIPLGPGEKPGPHAVEYACINGYRFMMQKNIPIELPKSVYELLANHYNIQVADPELGQQYRLDRSDNHLTALA